MTWQDTVEAVSSAVTATGVVVGGWWAYRRFIREAPELTRADARVNADLAIVEGEHDVLRVEVSVCALGRARLVIHPSEVRQRAFKPAPPALDDLGAIVSVYRYDDVMALTAEPVEWIAPLAAVPVLNGQTMVEAGETLRDVHLVSVGPRAPGTLGYRVEFNVMAWDSVLWEKYHWGSVNYVVLTHGDQEGGETVGDATE